jgi:hypothetical protein
MPALAGAGTIQAGCRSLPGTLDFDVHVALRHVAARAPEQASSFQERQMTLTLRPQDGAC